MKLIWIPGISSKRAQWAFARHYYHEYVNSNRAHSIDICFFLLAHLSVVSAILLDFIRRCNWMQFYVRRAQVTRNKPSTITQSAKYAFQWFECHWIVSVWTGFALHATTAAPCTDNDAFISICSPFFLEIYFVWCNRMCYIESEWATMHTTNSNSDTKKRHKL